MSRGEGIGKGHGVPSTGAGVQRRRPRADVAVGGFPVSWQGAGRGVRSWLCCCGAGAVEVRTGTQLSAPPVLRAGSLLLAMGTEEVHRGDGKGRVVWEAQVRTASSGWIEPVSRIFESLPGAGTRPRSCRAPPGGRLWIWGEGLRRKTLRGRWPAPLPASLGASAGASSRMSRTSARSWHRGAAWHGG